MEKIGGTVDDDNVAESFVDMDQADRMWLKHPASANGTYNSSYVGRTSAGRAQEGDQLDFITALRMDSAQVAGTSDLEKG